MRSNVTSRLVAAVSVLFMVSISFASPAKFTSAWTDTVPSFEFGAYVLGDTMKIQSDGAHGGVYAWDAFTLQDPAGNLKINHHIVAPELFTYTLLPTDLQGIWTACQKWWEYDDNGNKVWAFTVGTTIVTSPSGNRPPNATIDSISPSPADQYASVNFLGHGSDTDGIIAGWSWRSSINGQLSATASFSTSSLSVGNHAIYFKVVDNLGASSIEVSQQLVVRAAPVAKIVSITPTTAVPGALISFTGSGTDPNNAPITAYNWRSSIDGSLPGYASFQWGGLSPGIHTIYFKVRNNLGIWSSEVTSTVTIDDKDDAPLGNDLDPYVNLKLSVAIWEVSCIERVDSDSAADLYWKITAASTTINPYNSGPYWVNQDHIGGVKFSGQIATYEFDVSDSTSSPIVTVKIELWDDDDGVGKTKADDQCDISRQPSYVNSQKNMAGRAALVTYDLRTGDWTGDDGFAGDPNGIGHVSGTEDGSSASVDQDDCELWFWIWQNDYDHDGLTYQEEISRGTSPKLTENADYDGDGLWTDGEWLYNSKVDVKDSDADGIYDGYEFAVRRGTLCPTLQSDAKSFVANVYSNVSTMRDAVETYSYHLSYATLASWAPVSDIGWADMLSKYALDQIHMIKEMTESLYVIAPLGANPIELVADLLGEFALFYLAENLIWFNNVILLWKSYTTHLADYVYDSGLVYKVGWGTNWDESLHDTLSSMYSDLINLGNTLRNGPASFESARQIAGTALSRFGQVYAAAQNEVKTLHVTTSSGTSEPPVISSYDSTLNTYSALELKLYDFGSRLCPYVDSTTEVTWYGTSRITSGMIAQDLVNFAFNTFFVLKMFRLYLTGMINPT